MPAAALRDGRTRDPLILSVVALVARAGAALVVSWPPYTDPAYYSLVAQRLAEGHGFTVPVLWSFLEVGSRIPDQAVLPVASNGHWMPLTSIVAAGSMAIFGPSWQAGQLPMILLSAALVPFTYLVATEFGASRIESLVASVLAIFAGPLLVMYPTVDNFAVFGVAGALALWSSTRAVRSERPGPWLVLAGACAGLATLARVDGLLLAVAPLTAWLVRRGWAPWSSPVPGRAGFGWGFASAAAFLVVVAPWLARNAGEYGRLLPTAGGHTLWIRTYNEQFSIGHYVTPGTFLSAGPLEIVGSRLQAWFELVGRTGVLLGGVFLLFFVGGLWMWRKRPELAPFLVYFVVMFIVMGAVFTFHAPKGAFYHSAGAWLPFALAVSVAAVGQVCTAAGRAWPFLRRPQTHRFVMVAGAAGAIALSVIGSVTLYDQWSRSRDIESEAAAFLVSAANRTDVVMSSDPASLYPLTGNPGVAAPFDPYSVIERVVDAYGVDWVVVTRPGPGKTDPLALWNGASAVDITGAHPSFLGADPAFERGDLRIFRVEEPPMP
jgi:4-amino-4-deoxy-L-arabinose transferase-like glycosyltransferase